MHMGGMQNMKHMPMDQKHPMSTMPGMVMPMDSAKMRTKPATHPDSGKTPMHMDMPQTKTDAMPMGSMKMDSTTVDSVNADSTKTDSAKVNVPSKSKKKTITKKKPPVKHPPMSMPMPMGIPMSADTSRSHP
jgi:hypothetical protein